MAGALDALRYEGYKLTKEGYGTKPGQLPPTLKPWLLLFETDSMLHGADGRDLIGPKHKKPLTKHQQSLLRATQKHNGDTGDRRMFCPRDGFIPIDHQGQIRTNARHNGVPYLANRPMRMTRAGKDVGAAPCYLLMLRQGEDGPIAALAFLHEEPPPAPPPKPAAAANGGAPRRRRATSARRRRRRTAAAAATAAKAAKAADPQAGLPVRHAHHQRGGQEAAPLAAFQPTGRLSGRARGALQDAVRTQARRRHWHVRSLDRRHMAPRLLQQGRLRT